MGVVVYIGENLRRSRFRTGLTQRELAQRAGTTQTTVARIERDSVHPEITTIRRLASALEVPIVELLGDLEGDR
jgi:transcriptional regulator with XRE-family HTH domain